MTGAIRLGPRRPPLSAGGRKLAGKCEERVEALAGGRAKLPFLTFLVPALWVVTLLGCSGTRSPEGSSPAGGAATSSAPTSSAPEITHFYANATDVLPGRQVLLCYGVKGATQVRLEPEVADVFPVSNRCLGVTLRATTTFRLTAKNAQGAAVSETLLLRVRAGERTPETAPAEESPALITFFSASAETVRRGQPVTICYGAEGAEKVWLTPPLRPLEPAARFCFSYAPSQSLTVRLTAAKGDAQDSQELRIAVID